MIGAINDSLVVSVLVQAVVYGTPILFAALGELLAERSGVLNLGVEGMMLVGAVMGFWAMQRGPGPTWLSLLLAVLTAAFAALVISAVHAFLVISLRASQIVSGLALTIFAGGLGLSSYLGNDLGLADLPPKHQFTEIDVFGLKNVPVIGPVFLHQSALVYVSWALVAVIAFYLMRTRHRPQRACGRRVAWGSGRDGDQRRPLSIRARLGRRRARGRRRRLLQPRDHARLDRRRLARRRRGLDRDRARDLLVLASRAVPRRRVPVRRPLRRPALGAPGSRATRSSRSS